MQENEIKQLVLEEGHTQVLDHDGNLIFDIFLNKYFMTLCDIDNLPIMRIRRSLLKAFRDRIDEEK